MGAVGGDRHRGHGGGGQAVVGAGQGDQHDAGIDHHAIADVDGELHAGEGDEREEQPHDQAAPALRPAAEAAVDAAFQGEEDEDEGHVLAQPGHQFEGLLHDGPPPDAWHALPHRPDPPRAGAALDASGADAPGMATRWRWWRGMEDRLRW